MTTPALAVVPDPAAPTPVLVVDEAFPPPWWPPTHVQNEAEWTCELCGQPGRGGIRGFYGHYHRFHTHPSTIRSAP